MQNTTIRISRETREKLRTLAVRTGESMRAINDVFQSTHSSVLNMSDSSPCAAQLLVGRCFYLTSGNESNAGFAVLQRDLHSSSCPRYQRVVALGTRFENSAPESR